MNTKTLSIGTCVLGSYPRVAGVIDRINPIEELQLFAHNGADLLEVRVDLINQPFATILEYCSEIKIKVGIPIIGTIRENERTVGKRIDMFRDLCGYVDAIDVELGSPESDTILSHASGITIIVSEHDYEKTPSDRELKSMVERACSQGAHIVKLAVMAQSKSDVLRLLQLTQETTVPMVAIAMGPIGTISRLVAPLFGSLFTFGFIGESVAPGQLSAKRLIEEIILYYPER